jgi:hypothetical protein
VDWDRYRQLCDTPGVFSRWMLEQTQELLEPDLAMRIARVLTDPPLPKPSDHRGGAATDMFLLALTREDVARICRSVAAAAEAGVTTSSTTGRGLGGFREAWEEYLRALEGCRVP